jgi:hypothetical protein
MDAARHHSQLRRSGPFEGLSGPLEIQQSFMAAASKVDSADEASREVLRAGMERWLAAADLTKQQETWLRSWLTDGKYNRYLVAERGNQDTALKRLEATAKWRVEHVHPGASCPLCPTLATSHCMISIGLARDARPVVYASPPRAVATDAVAAEMHIAYELEKCFALPGAGPQWVWLMDMRGYTLMTSLAHTSAGIRMAQVFSAHYPERLGAAILLNPPTVFSVLLGAISPFLDKKTRDKIIYVHGEEQVADTLGALLTPEQLEWVNEAMHMDPTPGNLPERDLPAGSPPPGAQPLAEDLLAVVS